MCETMQIAVNCVINWSFFQVILSILKVEWQYVISSE